MWTAFLQFWLRILSLEASSTSSSFEFSPLRLWPGFLLDSFNILDWSVILQCFCHGAAAPGLWLFLLFLVLYLSSYYSGSFHQGVLFFFATFFSSLLAFSWGSSSCYWTPSSTSSVPFLLSFAFIFLLGFLLVFPFLLASWPCMGCLQTNFGQSKFKTNPAQSCSGLMSLLCASLYDAGGHSNKCMTLNTQLLAPKPGQPGDAPRVAPPLATAVAVGSRPELGVKDAAVTFRLQREHRCIRENGTPAWSNNHAI